MIKVKNLKVWRSDQSVWMKMFIDQHSVMNRREELYAESRFDFENGIDLV